jgi:hypothetical protein
MPGASSTGTSPSMATPLIPWGTMMRCNVWCDITGWFCVTRSFNWKNAFLFFDTWNSTIDQWLTEVIPTIIISAITGHWWLLIAYYVWAGFIQEAVEHNKRINLYPFLTSGKWHLIHHEYATKNYGVFVPIWDLVFGTWKGLDGNGKQLAPK